MGAWRLIVSMHGDRERECRSRPYLALDPDLAAVEFHELPTQSEPEARTLDLLCRRPHLPELLEDLLLILWSDPNAGIADEDLHESIRWHGTHVDPPTFGR